MDNYSVRENILETQLQNAAKEIIKEAMKIKSQDDNMCKLIDSPSIRALINRLDFWADYCLIKGAY